jgi:hypothetical protein
MGTHAPVNGGGDAGVTRLYCIEEKAGGHGASHRIGRPRAPHAFLLTAPHDPLRRRPPTLASLPYRPGTAPPHGLGPRAAPATRITGGWASSVWRATGGDGVWCVGADSAEGLRRKVGAPASRAPPDWVPAAGKEIPPATSADPAPDARWAHLSRHGLLAAMGAARRGLVEREREDSSTAVPVRHIGAAAPLFVSSEQWSSNACRGVPSGRCTTHARLPLTTSSGILLHKISTSSSLSIYPACFAAPHSSSPSQTLERSAICSFIPF